MSDTRSHKTTSHAFCVNEIRTTEPLWPRWMGLDDGSQARCVLDAWLESWGWAMSEQGRVAKGGTNERPEPDSLDGLISWKRVANLWYPNVNGVSYGGILDFASRDYYIDVIMSNRETEYPKRRVEILSMIADVVWPPRGVATPPEECAVEEVGPAITDDERARVEALAEDMFKNHAQFEEAFSNWNPAQEHVTLVATHARRLAWAFVKAARDWKPEGKS